MNSPAVTLLPGDCLALLPTLPAQSVDLVLADLPYGTTACKWDSVLPLDKLWAEYKRVLKPRGVVVLTGSQPFTSVLVLSNLDWFKYTWVWRKTRPNGFLNARKKPLLVHEDVAVFAPMPLSPAWYRPQGLIAQHRISTQRAETRVKVGAAYGKTNKSYLESHWTNYPVSVLDVPNETGLHPTQKPVALFSYLIRTYSNPGDLVLDNTAGSGTTGVAAIETGRRAILMERDPAYCAIIERRIAAAQPALLQEAS